MQHRARHLERAPHPRRTRVSLFHIDSQYATLLVRDYRIEELRMVHRKHEKRESIVGQRREAILRKPDRVRETNQYDLSAIDKRQRAKDRIAQTRRRWLHGVTERSWADLAAEVFENVRLARRHNETDLSRPAFDHAFDEILADRARPLVAILVATTDRQQLFGKCEWLNAAPNACRRHNSPHLLSISGLRPKFMLSSASRTSGHP